MQIHTCIQIRKQKKILFRLKINRIPTATSTTPTPTLTTTTTPTTRRVQRALCNTIYIGIHTYTYVQYRYVRKRSSFSSSPNNAAELASPYNRKSQLQRWLMLCLLQPIVSSIICYCDCAMCFGWLAGKAIATCICTCMHMYACIFISVTYINMYICKNNHLNNTHVCLRTMLLYKIFVFLQVCREVCVYVHTYVWIVTHTSMRILHYEDACITICQWKFKMLQIISNPQ